MYELVRTQLYLNMVHGVVIYYQLHVSASILAIIRFTLGLNLLREIYKLYGVLRGGERDLVLQIVGSLKCRNLGWSIDLRCSCCRGAPWSAVCERKENCMHTHTHANHHTSKNQLYTYVINEVHYNIPLL